MATSMLENFLALLSKSQLLRPEQLEEVTGDLQNGFPDAKALARELIRRRWLTTYQVNRLAQGRAGELVLGQYIILDRLGEGGMGEVFRARHRSMGRIVALKVLKKERLAKPNAIRRFGREMQAAARLSHPNIVVAYDADSVGDYHFFAMEYVDGVDLSNLIKQRGPVALPHAASYIRQAALGLQHAHEQGMVHRDIKPSNLLVSRDGATIKILDVGLARIGDPDDEAVSYLTQTGKIVGTADYIAPEQARNSHRADIRSDIYSLGCTLYYIVAGKVPFPGGGTIVERLLRHLREDPVPLRSVAPEVPENFAEVVHRMIRRNPDERYQTPTEVAAALEPFLPRATNGDNVVTAPTSEASTGSLDSTSALNLLPATGTTEPGRQWRLIGFVIAAVLAGLIAGIVGTRLLTPRSPEVVPKKSDSVDEVVPALK
jgi:serine/threonine protein kinase